MAEQRLKYMSEHMPGPKSVHVSQHMSDRNLSEHFPAFMTDDVSERKPDLMPEQASEQCVNLSG